MAKPIGTTFVTFTKTTKNKTWAFEDKIFIEPPDIRVRVYIQILYHNRLDLIRAEMRSRDVVGASAEQPGNSAFRGSTTFELITVTSTVCRITYVGCNKNSSKRCK